MSPIMSRRHGEALVHYCGAEDSLDEAFGGEAVFGGEGGEFGEQGAGGCWVEDWLIVQGSRCEDVGE